MRRAGILAFLTLAFTAGVALAVEAAMDERDLAFTLGVVPAQLAARLNPGEEACQAPVVTEERFAAVRFNVGASELPGGSIAATVREAPGGRTLATGRAVVYANRNEPTARLDSEVPEEARVEVCLRNTGHRQLVLHGGSRGARLSTGVKVDGRPKGTDLTLVFVRGEPRSTLSLVPEMFRRAALFRPAWVGAWTFWLLLALVLCGVPALLAAALRSAEPEASR